ncbi:MAG: response regulator [Lachnospiraceae bacterium]|nr:response regulator [Lachnospiraceae bacterium]
MTKILICDDAMFMRASIRKMVEAEGFQVVAEAGDGAECITSYQIYHPDLVLMDITMPDMDGITATQKIMEIDPNAKIIIVSALGLQEKVFQAVTAGAKDFVVKPFTKETLILCMKKYV